MLGKNVIVRLLGTAASGGFPQWNCSCAGCRVARRHPELAKPRTQFSIAVSADEEHWFLINASPDFRAQVEATPELHPRSSAVRSSVIEGILLTSADIQHMLGLFQLREGRRLKIYGTSEIRKSANDGLNVEAVLGRFCGADWENVSEIPAPLLLASGERSGILYSAISIPAPPPRYTGETAASGSGHLLAYLLVDESTRKRLLIAPQLPTLTGRVLGEFLTSDVLLVDGMFWSGDELALRTVRKVGASDLGYLPISGEGGTFEALKQSDAARKVFVHMNDTNPILIEDSPERAKLTEAGIEVGYDGMTLTL
jgi:pyrroloquinoline quinone biosynthesis protein B